MIGFGGGSALDTGKAIAALATNRGDPLDYLEVIGAATPDGAATALHRRTEHVRNRHGSHAQRRAASPEHRVKVSLRSPLMLPGWP